MLRVQQWDAPWVQRWVQQKVLQSKPSQPGALPAQKEDLVFWQYALGSVVAVAVCWWQGELQRRIAEMPIANITPTILRRGSSFTNKAAKAR